MLKSAENWVAGFFGLELPVYPRPFFDSTALTVRKTNNATIEVIIEDKGFNNSLAGSLNCPNAEAKSSGTEARDVWIRTYLGNATSRFQAMTEGFTWTIDDVYAA